MLGRFNDTLQMSNGKLIVAGTLSDCTAGDKVRIEATLTQSNKSVSCHEDFQMPPSGPLQWEMDVSAPFVMGTASGSAAWWRTRRCCSGRRGRPSRSATTPWTARRSCPA